MKTLSSIGYRRRESEMMTPSKVAQLSEFSVYAVRRVKTKYGERLLFDCATKDSKSFVFFLGVTYERECLIGESFGPVRLRKDGSVWVFEDLAVEQLELFSEGKAGEVGK